jgi:precorrin-8X/cobalt-precorrin-8 methylmutase
MVVMDRYSDLGAMTPEAFEISRASRELIARIVGDETLEDRIKQRCVMATGDPSIAESLRFVMDPVRAGFRALDEAVDIFVDIRMVEAGIVKKGHRSRIRTLIEMGEEMASRLGITRASAGVMAAKDELDGAVVVIGNAPTALLALCEIMERREAMPSLVIGIPVGFVRAAESKDRLRNVKVPSISNVGTRGGTPLAVAAMNEIINMYHQGIR